MKQYVWTRQQRGRVWGLKQHASPGYSINHWVIKGKDGFWRIDGQDQAGIVHGKYKTARQAKQAWEEELGIVGIVGKTVCDHPGCDTGCNCSPDRLGTVDRTPYVL